MTLCYIKTYFFSNIHEPYGSIGHKKIINMKTMYVKKLYSLSKIFKLENNWGKLLVTQMSGKEKKMRKVLSVRRTCVLVVWFQD